MAGTFVVVKYICDHRYITIELFSYVLTDLLAGCCWPFSAVAAIEGITQIKTGKLGLLSEQELVDCVSKNDGCSGGWMDYAFEHVKENGITTEENYKYKANDGH